MKNLVILILVFSTIFQKANAQNTINIFEDYPWLSALISPETCNTESVKVYQSGIYSYLLITDNEGTSTLRNQNGLFYCQNASNFDCVQAYQFDAPVLTWTCNSEQNNDCFLTDAYVAQLENQSIGCNMKIRISEIEYNGNLYYRTYTGRTQASIEQLDFPCAVQEYFGDIRTCDGTVVCRIGLVNQPDHYDPELCSAISRGGDSETVVWEHSESSCAVDDPYDLPFIIDIVNKGGILLTNQINEVCQYVETITQIDYQGFTYFRVEEISNQTSSCPSQQTNFKLYDCKGHFVGGAGDVPDCQSAALCSALITASGNIVWSYEEEVNNVCNVTGTIFFRECAPGQLYFFVRTDNDKIYDPYFETSATIDYKPIEGQRIKFAFQDTSYQSPCSIAEKAIRVTCVEILEENNNDLLTDYPWLSAKVDPLNCSTEKVELFQSSIYFYLLVTDADGIATLYNSEGLFYCQSYSTFDCVESYDLGSPMKTWTCDGVQISCTFEENIQTYIDEIESQAVSCYSPIRVTKINHKGETYFLTDYGRTRTSLEVISDPCYAQEYIEDIRDCSGAVLCTVSNGSVPSPEIQELCSSIRATAGIIMWESEDINCQVDSPLDMPFIKSITDANGIITTDDIGEVCLYVQQIEKIDYLGFDYFRITETYGVNGSCPVLINNIKHFDCEGNFVGGVGDVPLCQSLFLCSQLIEAQGEIIWSTSFVSGDDSLESRSSNSTVKSSDNEDLPIEFIAFPNPSHGLVTIRKSNGTQSETQVRVLDMTGKVLLETTIEVNSDELELDLSQQTNGIYLLECTTEDTISIERIVIRSKF